jgi:hypothetical protein
MSRDISGLDTLCYLAFVWMQERVLVEVINLVDDALREYGP